MKRREFISLLAGIVASRHATARAQEDTRVRRLGVFINLPPDDPEAANRVRVFLQGMEQLGWTPGRNLQVEYRWGSGDPNRYQKNAAELVALRPDVILAAGGPIVRILQQQTSTIPIVFVQAIDPISAGGVGNLRQPGSNITGFASIEYRIGEKRLEFLMRTAPHLKRIAILRDSQTPAGVGQFDAIKVAAQSLGVEVSSIDLRDPSKMQRDVAGFAQQDSSGMLVATSTLATIHRELITDLAIRHRLPAIFPNPVFVVRGGLMSYGSVVADQYRLAAGYVDRIFKGARPGDLPVQQANKYELAINLKTARSLGLTVPRIVLQGAETIIE